MRPYKTLIIEDDINVAKELIAYLDSYSHIISSPITVRSCKEAIDLLMNEKFDISILDIDLLDGTCFEIVDKVPRGRFGEIIFFTEYAGLFMKQMFKAEPIYYFAKPFDPGEAQEMVIKVDDYLGRIEMPLKFVELLSIHRGKKFVVNLEDILYIMYTPNPNLAKYYFRELNPDFPELSKKRYNYSDAVGGDSLLDQIGRLNDQFTQCSKNCILNLNYLREYTNNEKEGLDVLMPNGESIIISKGFKKEVLARKRIS